jgi:hypothetical protein
MGFISKNFPLRKKARGLRLGCVLGCVIGRGMLAYFGSVRMAIVQAGRGCSTFSNYIFEVLPISPE